VYQQATRLPRCSYRGATDISACQMRPAAADLGRLRTGAHRDLSSAIAHGATERVRGSGLLDRRSTARKSLAPVRCA